MIGVSLALLLCGAPAQGPAAPEPDPAELRLFPAVVVSGSELWEDPPAQASERSTKERNPAPAGIPALAPALAVTPAPEPEKEP